MAQLTAVELAAADAYLKAAQAQQANHNDTTFLARREAYSGLWSAANRKQDRVVLMLEAVGMCRRPKESKSNGTRVTR